MVPANPAESLLELVNRERGATFPVFPYVVGPLPPVDVIDKFHIIFGFVIDVLPSVNGFLVPFFCLCDDICVCCHLRPHPKRPSIPKHPPPLSAEANL